MEPVKRRNDCTRNDHPLGAGQVVSPRGTKAWSTGDSWTSGGGWGSSLLCSWKSHITTVGPPCTWPPTAEVTARVWTEWSIKNSTCKVDPQFKSMLFKGQLLVRRPSLFNHRGLFTLSRGGHDVATAICPLLSRPDCMAEAGMMSWRNW